ncbi:hypothetical protein LIER_14247 [Lithospermum erythrorhizon]|uniref:PGG domain-containing protein n=1 Tax=Lithospermum erythrorhizon TaxID=34254 RepID=A0AAV3Q0Y3_LITER
MEGATSQAEKGNAYQRLQDACETENPEDSKFGLDESSGSREDRKSPNPTGSVLLPSSSTLCIIAILFAAATVSAPCKLPGGVTKKINWVYMMFCLTNTFSFYSSLSVFPILLLGQLNTNFRVAAVKASSRMLQLSVISMIMAYCSGSGKLNRCWLYLVSEGRLCEINNVNARSIATSATHLVKTLVTKYEHVLA